MFKYQVNPAEIISKSKISYMLDNVDEYNYHYMTDNAFGFKVPKVLLENPQPEYKTVELARFIYLECISNYTMYLRQERWDCERMRSLITSYQKSIKESEALSDKYDKTIDRLLSESAKYHINEPA